MDEKAPPKGESKFEKMEAKNASLLGEVFGFLSMNKKWWLLPIVVSFVLFGALALLSATPVAPFIYPFF